jgi:hypothetical protein
MEAKAGGEEQARQVYEELLDQIAQRAAYNGLGTERVEREAGSLGLALNFGEDSDQRRVSVFRMERAEELLAVPFESYRFVPGYEAIFNKDGDEVEARLRQSGPFPGFMRERRPFDQPYKMTAPTGAGKQEIELTTASEPYQALNPSRLPPRIGAKTIVLKLRGFGARNPERAQSLLDDLTPSVLFELDIVYDTAVELVKAREVRRRSSRGWSRSDAPPEFPSNLYDREPVALYIYGRSARGMPLLEYLAYYQAIEHYFPRYAAQEVRQRVEGIVKDPRFNPHLDRDVGRLVEVVQGKGGRTYGSELEQLKATLRGCVEPEEIREFLQGDEQRQEFFRERRSPLTACTLTTADRNADLRDAAASRIYDLRCRIVHSKDEPDPDELQRLLPNSPEVQMLGQDLALLRLLAVRVIVASSRELVL